MIGGEIIFSKHEPYCIIVLFQKFAPGRLQQQQKKPQSLTDRGKFMNLCAGKKSTITASTR
jgi:hypothetical protein